MNEINYLEKRPLTMYPITLELLTALGVKSFAASGEKKLRSYESKRDFFSDDLDHQLLCAFAGNHKFKEKDGQYSDKFESSHCENTEFFYNYYFYHLQELVFLLQRESDICSLQETPFSTLDHLCAALAVVHVSLLNNHQGPIVKSCPFLYLEESIKNIIANDYDITKTIKKTISGYLDNLRGDQPKNKLRLYAKLDNLDEHYNQSKTDRTIYLEINDLKEDLKKIYHESDYQKIEDLTDELWGNYNALLALSRFRFSTTITSISTPKKFVKKLHEYILFTNHFFQFGDSHLNHLIAKITKNNPSKDKAAHYKAKEMAEPYRLASNRFSTENPIERTVDVYYNAFLREDAERLIIFDECFNQTTTKLKEQLQSISRSFSGTPNLINCLSALEDNSLSEAQAALKPLKEKLSTTPYFLQRFICLLSVGLQLAEDFKFRNNALSNEIDTYLNASIPSTKLATQYNDSNKELLESFQIKRYDLSSGLINLVNEYNRFITNNKIDKRFLVNPLENINTFLSDFLEKLEGMNPNEDNYLFCCTEALKGLKTKLTNAKIPFINYSLYNLEDWFMLEQTGLSDATLNDYEGTAAIQQFLNLPSSKQKIILEACHAVSPP